MAGVCLIKAFEIKPFKQIRVEPNLQGLWPEMSLYAELSFGETACKNLERIRFFAKYKAICRSKGH